MMLQFLQKKDQNGDTYVRSTAIEAMIEIAVEQNVETVVRRASISDRQSPDFLASECLVYLVREAWRCGDTQRMSTILPTLIKRGETRLRANLKGCHLPSIPETIEDILSEFSLLFLEDGTGENPNQLDYFECRFNSAFWTFRTDYLRRESVIQDHTIPVPTVNENEADDSSSSDEALYRLSPAFNVPISQQQDSLLSDVYYQDLLSAIDALPPDERAAVVLFHLYGYKEESQDTSETTAATLCGVSGRTIRNRLTRAARKLSRFNE